MTARLHTEQNEQWDSMLDRLQERMGAFLREKEEAPGKLEEILLQPATARQDLIYSHRRFQTLALCDLLIERAFEEGSREPALALHLAELAVVVADRLDAGVYGRSLAQDLRARAWAHLGNARRIASDFAGAERALVLAAELAESGSADPLEEARILDFRASLWSNLGRQEEAITLIDAVIDIYDEVQDLHRKGRALLSKGFLLGCAGFPEKALGLIPMGLSLVRWEEDPQLVLIARYNATGFMVDCRRWEQARLQLERLAPAYRGSADPWAEPRLAWLEGRIAAGRGRLDESEAALRRARWFFLVAGREYDAALVTLDLAAICIRQGKTDEVRQLTDQMVPLLLSQEIHRPAVTALVTFQRAAEMGGLTPHLIQEIASYLLRARHNPRLAFRDTAA